MSDNSKNLDDIQMPKLEETTYDPSAHRTNRSLDDIQAPKLDDTAYTPTNKPAGLAGVAMPTLSDTYEPQKQSGQQNTSGNYGQYGQTHQPVSPQFTQYGQDQTAKPAAPQFAQYGQNQTAQAASPQFTQYGQNQTAKPAAPQFTQYGQNQTAQAASPQFAQYGQNQTAQAANPAAAQTASHQYGQNNTVHRSALDDVAAPALSDEPPAEQRYVPKYADPDLEAAKKQSVDRAIKGSISAANESLDKEKSLAAYREFMREKESDMAKKGAKIVIILAVASMVCGLISLLYTSLSLKSGTPDAIGTINSFYIGAGILQLLSGGLMLAPTKQTQKAASTILTLLIVLHIVPGIIVMLNKAQLMTSILMYLAILIISIAVCFTLGSNENIKKHYNGHEID